MRTPQQKAVAAVGIWGALAIVAVVFGISIPGDDRMAWESVHPWGGLAILGAVMTLVPIVAGSNMSLVTTAGVVFGCIAAALAPGRPPARTP